MQLPLPSFRGLYFPPGGVLNQGHRLAFGLCFLVVPTTTWNYDLVTGTRAVSLVTSALVPQIRGTVGGQAVFFGNGAFGSDGVFWPSGFAPITTSNGLGGGDFSIAAVANPVNAAQLNFLFSQANGNGLEVYLCANQEPVAGAATAGAFTFLTDSGSAFTDVGVTSGATDGKPHVFMGTRLGTTLTLYIDGKQVAQTSGTLRAVVGLGSRILYGNLFNSSASNGANCGVVCAAAWNRALSSSEALEFGTNPSGLLTYPNDYLFATLVGTSAPPPTPTFDPTKFFLVM